MIRNAIFSRLAVALFGAMAGVIATEYPIIAQGVCFDILNSLDLDGVKIIDSLDNLPVFPESYYQEKIERLR